MFDFTFDGLPPKLQAFVQFALIVACIVSVWKNLAVPTWIKIIKRELTPNGGSSAVDRIKRAADDSTEALRLSKLVNGRTRAISRRQKTMEQRQKENTEQINIIKDRHVDMEKRIARFVIHEARGTLAHAQLVEEEQRLLKELDKEKTET